MGNQEKLFRRNKFKDIIGLFISIIFVVAGYSLLDRNLLMGCLGISFFGIGAMIFTIQLITNIAYLKLDEEGFEEKSLFKKKQFKWKNVSNFEIRSFRFNESIHFVYKDEFGNTNFRGIVSSYNIKSQDLVNLMKKYKKNKKTL